MLDKNKSNKISVIRFAWMRPSPLGYPKNKISNLGPVSCCWCVEVDGPLASINITFLYQNTFFFMNIICLM